MYESNTKPLEETDPELHDLLKWYCNSNPTKEINDRVPVESEVKVGRNDPCPCNSGKKYKKCCGKN